MLLLYHSSHHPKTNAMDQWNGAPQKKKSNTFPPGFQAQGVGDGDGTKINSGFNRQFIPLKHILKQ
jgi:hypothetical protein